MKVLIDARMYGLENTGIGRYVMNLLAELQKQDELNEYVILLQKKYYDELDLKKNFKKVLAEAKIYTLTEQIMLTRLIISEKPDLVHYPHFNISLFSRSKFIVTLHDLITHKTNRESTTLPLPVYLLKKTAYKILFNRAVNKSVKIIVPTEAVKKDIFEHYRIRRDKVITIAEGIDDNFLTSVKSTGNKVLARYDIQEGKYLIYAGNAFPHKNLKKVIEAISILKDKEIAVKLFIVTKNNKFKEKLRRLVDEKKLNTQVGFVDYVDDEELRALYRNSAAFIYPSLMEGFGLQGLEALAAGTKLIASDIPVFLEVYGECAFYFDPMNHFSIANAIEKAFSSEQKKGVNELLEKYSWTSMVKETMKVYNAVKI